MESIRVKMIISTATKSLSKRCNADMKEKLACEIYELITGSGLPLVNFCILRLPYFNFLLQRVFFLIM